MESYALFLSALILIAFLLSARSSMATVEAGMTDSSLPGYLSLNYNRFQGMKTARFRVKPGEWVKLFCDVRIENGELAVLLRDPRQEVVWEKIFSADAAERITFSPQLPGTYQLVIEGKNTRGGFDIQWIIDRIKNKE